MGTYVCLDGCFSGETSWLSASQGGPELTEGKEPPVQNHLSLPVQPGLGAFEVLRFAQSVTLITHPGHPPCGVPSAAEAPSENLWGT